MSDEELRTLQHEFEELRDRVAHARKEVAKRETTPPP
jgi:hypothetical protein